MMIDTVSALRQVSGALQGDVLQDVAQVANFDHMLAQAEAASVSGAGVGAANQIPADVKTLEVQPFAAATAPVGASTISESYWDGLRSLQTTTDKFSQVTAAAARDAGDGSGLSASRLIELQVAVMNYSMQAEIMAKVTDRVSQGIQTLFRNQ
jgi:hypothetical protein